MKNIAQSTLYISDLDGTLLDKDSRISPESAALINDLSARGAMITVATARTQATVDPLLQGVDMRPPAIVMTGAAFWHLRDKRLSHVRLVPPGDLDVMLDICQSHDVDPLVYTIAADDTLQVYHRSERLNPYEQAFINIRSGLALKHFNLGVPVPAEAKNSCVLLFALGEQERLHRAAEAMRPLVSCSVTDYPDYLNPGAGQIEIFGPGVSKASAVRALKHMIHAQRMVVFGDNLNDIPMMQQADVAVAVANAVPEVLEVADIVIGPNTEHSVAKFIYDDFTKNLN